MDTFTTLWNRVQLRVPAAGPDLCQDIIRDQFQQLTARRQWSWMMRTNSFYPPLFTNPGSISVTARSAVVTGAGTSFNSSMVGKQLRVGAIGGSSYPTYTITQYISPAVVILDRIWVGANLANQAYLVFQCYFEVPQDFEAFYSIINPSANYRLNHLATQAELDSYDPQRAQSGIAYAVAFYDFTKNYEGSIAPAIPVYGTGSSPVTTTATGYSYPQDSLYSIRIASGGASGVATFDWKQDGGTTSGTGLLTDINPINLSNGVQVYFPVGTYNAGDVFAFYCKSDATTSVARYEMWPRPISASFVYPYTYVVKPPALTDDQPQLPTTIARRGDVLVEMALAQLALWPGTDTAPNKYANPVTANTHRITAERLIYELEKKDDDIAIKDLTYQGLPYMGPWRDGSWLQTHAIYPDVY